jgi:hypothetical protein
VSNPIRYRFGEEKPKGYGIVLHGPRGHLYQFMPIESFRYDTISINDIQYNDPNDVVNYLDNLQANGIDHVRIDFTGKNDPITQSLVEKYYSNNPNVAIKRYTESTKKDPILQDESNKKFAGMDFLVDNTLDSYTKFVNFVNYNEGKQFITVEQLKTILSGGTI